MEESDLTEKLLTEIVSAAGSQMTAAPNWRQNVVTGSTS